MTLFRLLHGKHCYERQALPRDRIKDSGLRPSQTWGVLTGVIRLTADGVVEP